MKQLSLELKDKKTPSILSAGHHYWIDNKGVEHIIFYDNKFGRKLKKMWEQLHKPIKVSK